MKKIILVLTIIIVLILVSCNQKICPTYADNSSVLTHPKILI